MKYFQICMVFKNLKVLTDVTVADLLDLEGIATVGRFKAESPNMK